ncbi:LysE family transporter [Aciduricibacillus chroicocephali]|uniref:LysE family transporter n=1 Tax=Aciduricibacillus chroicocephali TaxID=3054939 RepID=A0ABY9KVM7_9BACI|nr:LysE family transporter [Bacillaceae bacterium 44XB]
MTLFISGFLLGMSMVLDLGTANVALIRTGIIKGFLAALLFALGTTVSDMVYAVCSVLGIAALLQSSSIFHWILWIAGTVVLLFLAYHSIRDAFKPKSLNIDDEERKKRNLFQQFLMGMGIGLSAPTTLLWFATVGGSVVSTVIGGVSFDRLLPFFIGFLSISVIWGAVLAYISSLGGKVLGGKMMKGLSLISGLLFLGFAGYVFFNGLNQL